MDAIFGPAHRYYEGAVVEVIIRRYYWVHYFCGVFAILHLVMSWISTGRPFQRVLLGLVGGMLLFGVIGGFYIQPKLNNLRTVMYGGGGKYTQAQAVKAHESFKTWHAASQVMNFTMFLGVGGFLFQFGRPASAARFFSQTKYSME